MDYNKIKIHNNIEKIGMALPDKIKASESSMVRESRETVNNKGNNQMRTHNKLMKETKTTKVSQEVTANDEVIV